MKTLRPLGLLAVHACIAYTVCVQYTIRGIPQALDDALRNRARSAGKSLNEAAVEAMVEGAGLTVRRRRRSLTDIAGTWKADKSVEAALAAQDLTDQDMWK